MEVEGAELHPVRGIPDVHEVVDARRDEGLRLVDEGEADDPVVVALPVLEGEVVEPGGLAICRRIWPMRQTRGLSHKTEEAGADCCG